MGSLIAGKSAALLRFLKDTATLRRKRIPAYGAGDKLLWFSEVPRDRPECRSAFIADNPAEFPDLWIKVRKKRMPLRPPLPELVKDWVRPQDLDQVDQEPEYCRMAARYLKAENPDLFSNAKLLFEKATTERACLVREDHELYDIRPAKKKLD